jgi:hypothetical protein
LIETVLSRLIRQTDMQMEAYNHANRVRARGSERPRRQSAAPMADELHLA